eukprot:Seg1118.1 transcript_id=Seg1118.1/GoldUCD/mRNA.D3Y31 product="hypothetical protein" protein_id=Seg1118.1/GoldUCD/D3Y31
MQGNRFKTKIIGGKLVHVPDFDYVREYDQNVVQSRNEGIKQLPQGYGNTSEYTAKPQELNYLGDQSRKEGYMQGRNQGGKRAMVGTNGERSPFAGLLTGGKISQFGSNEDRRKMINFPKIGNNIRSTGGQYESMIDRGEVRDVALDQRVSNRMEAERNRRKIQAQIQGSSLVLDPVPPDREEHSAGSSDDEKYNAALSKQVTDCLQNTNKQKLAFALRAMQRLDHTGEGYISVKQFRDVLLMYQIFIIGGTLEKLIEKYKTHGGKINYARMWNFVTDSYDSRNKTPQSSRTETKEISEEKTVRDTIDNVERALRTYAQRHGEIFDLKEMIKSFDHCDRSQSNLMHINEMRIICCHYLPIGKQDIEMLLRDCNHKGDGWIDYGNFVRILHHAQPTYLPPIQRVRRNTYTLEDNELQSLQNKTIKNETTGNNRTIKKSNEPDNSQRFNDRYEKEKFHFDQDWAKEKKHFDRKTTEDSYMNTGGNRRDVKEVSPRRKWYESEESWRKRKRKDRRLKTKQNVITRKRWENSAPVSSLQESRGKT